MTREIASRANGIAMPCLRLFEMINDNLCFRDEKVCFSFRYEPDMLIIERRFSPAAFRLFYV